MLHFQIRKKWGLLINVRLHCSLGVKAIEKINKLPDWITIINLKSRKILGTISSDIRLFKKHTYIQLYLCIIIQNYEDIILISTAQCFTTDFHHQLNLNCYYLPF